MNNAGSNNDIVYFELNNWFCGRDYPKAEPFISWLRDDLHQTLTDDKWAKENKLCIVAYSYDMSLNYLVTATKEWVMQNCPDLLSDKGYDVTFRWGNDIVGWEDYVEHYSFTRFLRFPDPDDCDEELGDGPIYGRGDIKFLEYKEENFGVHWEDDPLWKNAIDDNDEDDDEEDDE